MKKVVPVASFDWDGFLEETLKNLENMVTRETLVIRQVDKHVEYYEDWRDRDLLEDLRAENTRLFIHFAIDNLDNAVVLADDTTKLYVDPNVVSTEDEDTYDEAREEARRQISFNESESVGYVFERRGDKLVITTGWYAGGCGDSPPSLDLLMQNEELDFYGFAMERYIDQFLLA